MNPHYIASERLVTPLCEATHKTRAKLLVASATGIVIFHTGLVPEKIEGFGIEFSASQQNAMLLCLLALIVFLLISFLISVVADVTSIRLQRKQSLESGILNIINEALDKSKDGDQKANAWYSAKQAIANISKRLNVAPWVVTLVSRTRLAWDAILPIVVAVYAIVVLVIFLNHGAIG